MTRAASRLDLRLAPLMLVLLLLGGCGGCQRQTGKVLEDLVATFGEVATCPQSDSTPPAVELAFTDPETGRQMVLKPNHLGLRVNMQPKDRFFVTATAEDPEGVAKIEIYGPTVSTCKSDGEFGCRPVQPQVVPSVLTPSRVTTRLWIPFEVAFYEDCPAPCRTDNWLMTIHATATNCGGQQGQSTPLEVQVQFPP